MPIDESTYIETNEQYHVGLAIDEYNGTISIASVRQYDGKCYQRWCKPQIGKDKFSDKALPMKITIGNAEQAERLIRVIAEAFGIDVGLGFSEGNSSGEHEAEMIPF